MNNDPNIPFREVGAAEAVALARDGYRVIDVREQAEWDAGHVAGATLLPAARAFRAASAEVVPDRDAPLLLHCAVGARSARAAAWLTQMGYTDVVSLKGPISQWKDARRRLGGAGPAPDARPSSAATRGRSSSPRSARRASASCSTRRSCSSAPAGSARRSALYLAASGVGTIGLVDDDVVDESNLQRQVLHGVDRLGMRKVDSAELTMRGLNPETTVVKHVERLDADNVERLIADYDVIVDGTDNFDTRYVLNDAAVKLRKPVVHGSIYRWDGQVTTFVPFEGPCYRCMYPTQPPDELAPACSVAGVLGVLPGIVGMLQANEVFKLRARRRARRSPAGC